MTEASAVAIKTAVELIDDTVYTDGIGTPSKAVGIAGTDGTNPQIVKTDTAGELQVDVLTLPAIPAGANNIGDVDVLTVPAPLNVTGTGLEATAMRVTIATDSTGLLSVDDNGGSLTVDGTVTANLAAGVNNIGDVDILSIAAGTNNIGDVDIASAIPAGTNVIGGVTGGGIYVAATSTVVASGTVDVQGIAATANLRLVGFSMTEDAATAAAAELSLRHGTLVTDPEIFGITLAANESMRDWFSPDGIAVANGIFIDRVSGTTKMTLFTKVVA